MDFQTNNENVNSLINELRLQFEYHFIHLLRIYKILEDIRLNSNELTTNTNNNEIFELIDNNLNPNNELTKIDFIIRDLRINISFNIRNARLINPNLKLNFTVNILLYYYITLNNLTNLLIRRIFF